MVSRQIIVSITSVILFYSCLSDRTTTLASTHPAVGLLVEHYNQESTTTHPLFFVNITEEDVEKNNLSDQTDLIISRQTNPQKRNKRFALFQKEDLHQKLFIPLLYKAGQANAQQQFLPLAYTVPVIFSLETERTTPRTIELSQLLSGDPNNNQQFFSFSPLYEDLFFWHLLTQLNMKWDKENIPPILLEEDQNRLLALLEPFSATAQDEIEFISNYGYLSSWQLLRQKRLKWTFGNLRQGFYYRSLEPQLRFSYLSHQGQIFIPPDEILFLGVHTQSAQKVAVKNFITWLLQAETQKKLIALYNRHNPYGFGFFDGLSSFATHSIPWEVQKHRQEFQNRIPLASELQMRPSYQGPDAAKFKRNYLSSMIQGIYQSLLNAR